MNLIVPVVNQGCWHHDYSLINHFCKPERGQKGAHLDRLSKPHVICQDAPITTFKILVQEIDAYDLVVEEFLENADIHFKRRQITFRKQVFHILVEETVDH